ncbi:SCO family protein [Planctomicrobium sp. SH668]|uniref:SCO family protein n=1 Tax=Planctomicrobium sp. SH668 TaxID=3448126 RepID=UPI003F5C8202
MNSRYVPDTHWISFACVTAVALLLNLVVGSAGFAQGPPKDIGFDQRMGEKIPLDLQFKDQSGKTVELGSYFGDKPVILMPVYYKCPMLCGLELNGMVRGLRGLHASVGMTAGKDFQIVTFSIDPTEKPALAEQKRKGYLAGYGVPEANDGWHFLTGEKESIDKLCQVIGFRAKWDEKTEQYQHAAGVVVCTPTGIVSRYLYGVEFAPRDLRLAVVESSEGRVGSAADHVLLFCFSYNPDDGTYGRNIRRLLQVSGVLTVILLGGGVGLMLMRERKLIHERFNQGGGSHA